MRSAGMNVGLHKEEYERTNVGVQRADKSAAFGDPLERIVKPLHPYHISFRYHV